MYEIGTKVYVKSINEVGRIIERNWLSTPTRHATYIVMLVDERGEAWDYMTGSDDLRRADRCCDGCGKWLPFTSFNGGASGPDGEYPNAIHFCFLCTRA